METQARVQAALDAIHGVDLNPFAVAIARFRLTLAALQASGLGRWSRLPRSLSTWPSATPSSTARTATSCRAWQPAPRSCPSPTPPRTAPSSCPSSKRAATTSVVGNPPYITVKDKALNQIYRSKYADVCKGKYALTVPFMKLVLRPGEEW